MPRLQPDLRQPLAGPVPCATCGAPVAARWCGECGQPRLTGRLTMRRVVTRVVAAAFDLEKGLLHTAWLLSRRPARVVRDFVDGRTVTYTNPIKYFILALTLAQLVAWWTGAMAGVTSGYMEGRTRVSYDEGAVLTFLREWFVVLLAPGVPLLAGFTRLLFRRAGANYAEHLVFCLFVCGHIAVLFAASAPVASVLPDSMRYAAEALLLVGLLAYFVSAAVGFFRARVVGGVVRAILALVFAGFGYALMITVLEALIR